MYCFKYTVQSSSERTEPRASPNALNARKDILNNENKMKGNENKQKRSITTMNGSKDNGETPSKVIKCFLQIIIFIFILYL
jgi:hypothetical protein